MLAEMLINCDEAGRLRLQNTLTEICLNLRDISIPFADGQEDQFNDVYEKCNQE